MADGPAAGVIFDRATAAVLLEMARDWLKNKGRPGPPKLRRAAPMIPRERPELAVVVDDPIPRGQFGQVKLRRGSTKGDEGNREQVKAFNRQFAELPVDTEVFLLRVGGGWEIVQVLGECASLADPTAVDGYLEEVDLIPMFGADGCWHFLRVDDC